MVPHIITYTSAAPSKPYSFMVLGWRKVANSEMPGKKLKYRKIFFDTVYVKLHRPVRFHTVTLKQENIHAINPVTCYLP